MRYFGNRKPAIGEDVVLEGENIKITYLPTVTGTSVEDFVNRFETEIFEQIASEMPEAEKVSVFVKSDVYRGLVNIRISFNLNGQRRSVYGNMDFRVQNAHDNVTFVPRDKPESY